MFAKLLTPGTANTGTNNARIAGSDVLLALLLAALAAAPRLLDLGDTPPGLHGDEAWTGLDARRILDTGPIAPYVGSAMGQPTGPLYVTALVFALWDESITTLRLSMALFGVATVPILYLLLRQLFPRAISIVVTVSFAFAIMHLHFSRLGFMVISAPFFQSAALLCLALAVRRRRLLWAGATGLWTGLGLYSYNAFLAFPPLVLAYLLYLALFRSKSNMAESNSNESNSNESNSDASKRETPPPSRIYYWLQVLVFVLAFGLVTVPLTRIMLTNPDFYFARHRGYSAWQMPAMQAATSLPEQVSVLASHVGANLRLFVRAGKIDGVDGFGAFYNFSPLQVLLMATGIAAILWRRKRDQFLLLALGSGLLLSAALTFDGVYRRQMLSLIPLFVLMGWGLHYWLGHVGPRLRLALLTLVALGVIIESGYTLHTYRQRVVPDPGLRNVLAGDLVQTIRTHVDTNSPEITMVLVTDGFYCNHESIRFLAPDRPCRGGRESVHTDLFNAPPDAPLTLLLLPPYHDYVELADAWAVEWHATVTRTDVVDNGRLVSILFTVNGP